RYVAAVEPDHGDGNARADPAGHRRARHAAPVRQGPGREREVAMATIDLLAVRKTYPNGVDAVKGIDLAVADGELIVLLGPSGCGKSTLLGRVAGLETVTNGEVRIGGVRVNDKEPAARDIAMVFQNYALYPHMRVYDNMAYGLRNRRMARGEIDRRVRAAAE